MGLDEDRDEERDDDRDSLVMWVVYCRPSDYPDKYVARKFLIGPGSAPTGDVIVTEDLGIIQRQMRRKGLYRIYRDEQDEPQIVESWL